MGRPLRVLLLFILFSLSSQTYLSGQETQVEPHYSYNVINEFPHDPKAFTQGFTYYRGFFYEGTGLYGRSSLRKVKIEDGSIVQKVELPNRYFGEGITLFEDKIIQLTWRENRGFIYDKETFTLLDSFTYSSEGWGLTTDGEYLIKSDGSSSLTFLDPHSFQPRRKVHVTSLKGAVKYLNELEYVNGEIFANIWLTDLIARIDPNTGTITGWIDLSNLLDPEYENYHLVDVLNGIAYDPDNNRLFVTGKLWPKVYEIELIPINDDLPKIF